jgi:hypothetical protein
VLLQAISIGSEVDLRAPRAGRVHSAFAHAVNLAVDGELWTVFDADHAESPFGLRLTPGALQALADLRPGDPVGVRAGHAGLGPHVIDGRGAVRWVPARWPAPAAGMTARLAILAQAAGARAWPGSQRLADEVLQALRSRGDAADRQLAEAARRTLGHGPGLTPAGDDVLVGVLTLLRSGAAGEAGARAGCRLVAGLVPHLDSTTDLSRHLIRQAARGLPGAALHGLVQALFEGAGGDGLRRALAAVLAIGATSGADACLGLVAACRFLFPADERLAA